MNISQLNDLEESLIEEKVAKYRLKLQNAHKEKVESRKKHIIAAENNIRKAEEDLPQVLNEIEEKIKKGINNGTRSIKYRLNSEGDLYSCYMANTLIQILTLQGVTCTPIYYSSYYFLHISWG